MDIRKIEEELPAGDIATMQSTVCSDPLSVALPTLPESSSGNPLSLDIGGVKVGILSQDISYGGQEWDARGIINPGPGNKSFHIGVSFKL